MTPVATVGPASSADGLLADVFEVAPTPLWVIAADGTVQMANQAALTLLGYSCADEVVGAPSHATLHDHRPDGTHYPSEACPILDRPGSTGAAPEWFLTRDGRPLPVTWSTRTLGGSGCRLLSFRDASHLLDAGQSLDYGTHRSRSDLRTEVLDRIQERFRDPEFTTAALAAEVHLSVRSVQQLLAEGGTSPAAEIRQARLAYACGALARGASVTAAAAASGFADVGTFSRAFRRTYGESPGTWARRAG